MHATDGPEKLRATPRLAAYHEAGHAVACFFRPPGSRTTWITIRRADLADGDAGVHYSQRTLRPAAGAVADLAEVRASAVVSLAGVEVDRRLTGNELTSGSADYEEVRELLFRMILDDEIEETVAAVTPEQVRARGLEQIAAEKSTAIDDHLERLLDELRDEASDLIDAKWPHVEAVAEALLEREALSGEEVRAIIQAVEDAGARGPVSSEGGTSVTM